MRGMPALLALAMFAAGGTPAAAARTLPSVATFLGPPGPQSPQIRPRSIVYTGDGTGSFAGFGRAGHRPKTGRIHWSLWTAHQARGRGADWVDDCTPDCADGLFTAFPVRLRLYRPRHLGAYYVFTRLRGAFLHSLPPGLSKRRFTMRLTFRPHRGGFSWTFPI